MLTISVVIPTCDRPDYLGEAVACVLEQSRPADEIIVVNNGGALLGPNLLPERVIIHEMASYIGASRARNQGVTLAKGDYIAFLDDDDLWEPNYLQKVASIIEKQQPDCIVARLDKLVDGQVYPYKNADNKLNLATLFVRNPGVGGQVTIIRRQTFNSIFGYDQNLVTGEDKALIIDLLLNGYSIVTAPHVQAIIRIHNSLRLSDPETMQEGVFNFLKKYSKNMSLAQKNYNWLKVYFYRYRVNPTRHNYFFYQTHYFMHVLFCKKYQYLPIAPKIA